MNIKFCRDGKVIGDYPEEAVPALLQSKVLNRGDFFWHEGLSDWKVVASRWPNPAEPPPLTASVEDHVGRVIASGLITKLLRFHKRSNHKSGFLWAIIIAIIVIVVVGIKCVNLVQSRIHTRNISAWINSHDDYQQTCLEAPWDKGKEDAERNNSVFLNAVLTRSCDKKRGVEPWISCEDIRFLISQGIDINSRRTGYTALMCASSNDGDYDAAKVLVENGADVNALESRGCTALIMASCQGHTGIVRLLLEHGANVTMIDRGGKTALDWAISQNHDDIVDLLRRYKTCQVDAIARMVKDGMNETHEDSGQVDAIARMVKDGMNETHEGRIKRVILVHVAGNEYKGVADDGNWLPCNITLDVVYDGKTTVWEEHHSEGGTYPVGVACNVFGLSTEGIARRIKDGLNKKYSADPSRSQIDIKITNVTLVHKAGNKYEGVAACGLYNISIYAVYDGKNLIWTELNGIY